MLIQSLEQKTKLALMTVLATVVGCTVICGICIFFCAKLVSDERSQIYVLDGGELRHGGQGAYSTLSPVFLQSAA